MRRGRAAAGIGVFVLAALAAGCASAPPAATTPQLPTSRIEPGLDSLAVARTAPSTPLHIVFSWSLTEGSNRFSGRGVARVAPPYRARLDLFGPRGESYLSAVLVDRELRLPPGVANAPLPPPEMLWSALGVFLPPEGGTLATASRTDEGGVRLEYRNGEERWRYLIGPGLVKQVEHDRPGAGRETVELSGTGPAPVGMHADARYRDWTAFVELNLRIEEARQVAAFPSDIWSLDR